MKHIKALLVVLTLFISGQAFAQCVPDPSYTVPGIYPDSAAGIPRAYVGVPYVTDIQFRVPTDTIYQGLPATIDSINVINVTGLPSGFTYSCTPSGCSFPGGSNGCMQITSANPLTAGVYPIVVEMTVYGRVFGFAQSIPATNDNYTIYIDNQVSVISPSVTAFNVGQNAPNPSKGLTEIPVSSPSAGYVDVKISDLIGKVVYTAKVHVPKGNSLIPINTASMRKGVYVYTVSNGGAAVSKRMIIAE